MDLRAAYRILEVSPGDTRDQIRDARNVLAKVWHPDRYEGDPKVKARAEQKLKDINEAYAAIANAGFPTELEERQAPSPPPPPPNASGFDSPTSPPPPRPPPQQSYARPPEPAPSQNKTGRGTATWFLLFVGVSGAIVAAQRCDAQEQEEHDTPSPRYVRDDPPINVDPSTPSAPIATAPSPRIPDTVGNGAALEEPDHSADTFTLGSKCDEVRSVQGTPSGMNTTIGETWEYGTSRVEFREGKVIGWFQSPLDKLKIELRPTNHKDAQRAIDRGYFTLGSSYDEVLALQKTPTGYDRTLGETWSFQLSRVEFRGGRVSAWQQSPLGPPLHVKILPTDERVALASKARGTYGPNATKDEVLGVEGTPDGINSDLGDTWSYGTSRIEFSSGKIKDYSSSPLRPLMIGAPTRPVDPRAHPRGSLPVRRSRTSERDPSSRPRPRARPRPRSRCPSVPTWAATAQQRALHSHAATLWMAMPGSR